MRVLCVIEIIGVDMNMISFVVSRRPVCTGDGRAIEVRHLLPPLDRPRFRVRIIGVLAPLRVLVRDRCSARHAALRVGSIAGPVEATRPALRQIDGYHWQSQVRAPGYSHSRVRNRDTHAAEELVELLAAGHQNHGFADVLAHSLAGQANPLYNLATSFKVTPARSACRSSLSFAKCVQTAPLSGHGSLRPPAAHRSIASRRVAILGSYRVDTLADESCATDMSSRRSTS